MKNIIILLFVFCTLSTYGQKKITKIGVLELGMHIDSVFALAGNDFEVAKTDDDYFSKIYSNKGYYYYELIADTVILPSYSVFPFSRNRRVLAISSMVIANNITLKKLELSFWNDRLYSVKCEISNELEEALTLKYGKPKLEVKTTPKTYTNGLGIKVVKNDESYSSVWNPEDLKILCKRYISKYHNSKGEENYFSYFILEDLANTERIGEIEEKIKNDYDQKGKKNKYSDF